MRTLKIGRTATTVANDDQGRTVVTYHATRVVTFDNQRIVLNSGGYRSNTTKKRMNEVSGFFGLGYQVWQVRGNWFVGFEGQEYQYRDGMILDRLRHAVYANQDDWYEGSPMMAEGIKV